MEEMDYKEEIAYFMRRLYQQKLTTTSGGNLSVRTEDGTVLITPSASDKGRMTADEIVHIDMKGNIIEGTAKPSIEGKMHVAIYEKRPDVRAIVHAHPVFACAFASGSAEINVKCLSESYAILGEIAYSDYHRMGTTGLADSVASAAEHANCLLMRNHGAIAVGTSLLQAFDRLEVLESAAQVTLINRGPLAGCERNLPEEELAKIDALMGR